MITNSNLPFVLPLCLSSVLNPKSYLSSAHKQIQIQCISAFGFQFWRKTITHVVQWISNKWTCWRALQTLYDFECFAVCVYISMHTKCAHSMDQTTKWALAYRPGFIWIWVWLFFLYILFLCVLSYVWWRACFTFCINKFSIRQPFRSYERFSIVFVSGIFLFFDLILRTPSSVVLSLFFYPFHFPLSHKMCVFTLYYLQQYCWGLLSLFVIFFYSTRMCLVSIQCTMHNIYLIQYMSMHTAYRTLNNFLWY